MGSEKAATPNSALLMFTQMDINNTAVQLNNIHPPRIMSSGG